jgi:hypothetical protein
MVSRSRPYPSRGIDAACRRDYGRPHASVDRPLIIFIALGAFYLFVR